MKLEIARSKAEEIKAMLAPYCSRCEIAGSIRRERPEANDIEIVYIPNKIECLQIVNGFTKVKGEATGKYTQRIVDGIKVDFFTAKPETFGLIFSIRTGSAEFSHRVLAMGWVRAGYKSVDGMLTKNGKKIPTPEEADIFKIIGREWVHPNQRELSV